MSAARVRLTWSGKEVLIQPAGAAQLRDLAVARAAAPGGWLQVPDGNGPRQRICRLRKDLQALDPEARSWIENSRHGRYRLTAACPPINVLTNPQGELL